MKIFHHPETDRYYEGILVFSDEGALLGGIATLVNGNVTDQVWRGAEQWNITTLDGSDLTEGYVEIDKFPEELLAKLPAPIIAKLKVHNDNRS